MDIITSPRYEDFDLTYHTKNLWAHLGMGYSVRNREKQDWSPYLGLQYCDPKWMKAVGAPVPGQLKRKAENGIPSPIETDLNGSWEALTDGSISP
jgi:hypothetical protein